MTFTEGKQANTADLGILKSAIMFNMYCEIFKAHPQADLTNEPNS